VCVCVCVCVCVWYVSCVCMYVCVCLLVCVICVCVCGLCRSSLWRLHSDFFLFDFSVTSEKLAATLEKALAPVMTTRGGAVCVCV